MDKRSVIESSESAIYMSSTTDSLSTAMKMDTHFRNNLEVFKFEEFGGDELIH